MMWESWSAFWSMGGRGAFVWGSYGLLLAAIIAELVTLRSARNAALLAMQQENDH